jgi:citronellol/citronellal dehydrogenase
VVVDNVAKTVPLGRMGTEEEWAWLVAYLASPAGDFYSGATITMDGARDNWFGSWPPGMYGDSEGSRTVPAEERKPKD